ncbi:MAG: hypothetical protein OXT09_16220 [Myxococcales bacterium]|nr:hypothetical protein [Myxococcales bacterium]
MPTRRHLMFLLDESEQLELARLRHAWDPRMAAGVPPHVTLVYPEETNDERLLLERGASLASASSPFALTLGLSAIT